MRIAGVLAGMLTSALAPAADAGGGLEFQSTHYDGGEAWLMVRNRGDSAVTVQAFRWSDSPQASPLNLVLEPQQQSSVALPRSGQPPIWLSLGDGQWISETGARESTDADAVTAQGFVLVETPAAVRPAPPPVVPTGSWSVVLGSFLSQERAQNDARSLAELGYRAEVAAGESAGRTRYRVVLRGYATAPEARAVVAELAARHGRRGGWILHD